jgi:hypothetical protein
LDQLRNDLVDLYRNAAATERAAGFFDTAFLYAEIAHAAEQGLEVQKASRFRGIGAEFSVMLRGEDYKRAYLAFCYGYDEEPPFRAVFQKSKHWFNERDLAALAALEGEQLSLFNIQAACLLYDTSASVFSTITGFLYGRVGDDGNFEGAR